MPNGYNDRPDGCADTGTSARPDSDQIDRRLVVTPRRAWRMLDCGATHGYELLAAGELDSYLDGRARRITVASIEKFITRKLATPRSGETRGDLVEPAVRARKRTREQAR